MGCQIVEAAIEAGHEVIVVSGPVSITYPQQATVLQVQTTAEMLASCQHHFESCDGLIAAAAPCDYRPKSVAENKLKKDGQQMLVEFVPTVDILATMGQQKRDDQWTIGFALESENERANAREKLQRKNCDWIVLNRPEAIGADESQVEILDKNEIVWSARGGKNMIARKLIELVAD